MDFKNVIAIDAMGGDNAPGEIIKGAIDAINERADIKLRLLEIGIRLKQSFISILIIRNRLRLRIRRRRLAVMKHRLSQLRRRRILL